MNKNFLVVPIHLDALYLARQTQVTGEDVHFERLPYVSPTKGDVNPDTPYISESIASPPFSSEVLYLNPGVHLHWALPDALTHGRQGGQGAVNFPIVPNRWLVIKTVGNGSNAVVNKWVVESDYLYPEDAAGVPNSIAYPYEAAGRNRPYTYLGRSLPLEAWREGNASDYLMGQATKELTAVGYGNHNFAGYYPNCHSNFGFQDTETIDTAQTHTYEVIGWYSDADKDYLTTFLNGLTDSSDADKIKAMQEQLQWHLDENSTLPDASIYYAKTTIEANEFDTENPKVAPGQNTPVSVGNTGTEALSAYLANTIKNNLSSVDPSNTTTVTTIEEQLEAVQILDEVGHQKLDIAYKFYEARQDKSFQKIDGGKVWVIRAQSKANQMSANAEQAQDGQQVTLPDPLAHQLNALNDLQNQWDQAMANTESAQKQLYADWYKYQIAKYPPADQANDYPEVGLIEQFIRSKDLGPIQKYLAAAQNLQEQITWTRNALEMALASYNQLHTHNQLVLQATGASRYYAPNHPTVLMVGQALESTLRHGQDGRVRSDGLLSCVLLANQTIENLRSNQAPVVNITRNEADFNAIAVNTRATQPWNPLALEWEVEVFPQARSLQSSNAGNYAPDYIQSNYTLTAERPDLRLQPNRGVVRSANVFSGRTNLSPEATLVSLIKIRAYFQRIFSPIAFVGENTVDNNKFYQVMITRWDQDPRISQRLQTFYSTNNINEDQRRTATNLKRAFIWYIKQVVNIVAYPASTMYKTAEAIVVNDGYLNNASADVLKKIVAWHLSTTGEFDIEGYFQDENITPTNQSGYLNAAIRVNKVLKAYLTEEGPNINVFLFKTDDSASPFIASYSPSVANGSMNDNLSRAYAMLMEGSFHAQSQSLGGFNDALLMHKSTVNLNIADPLAFVRNDDFVQAVRACLEGTQTILTAPQPLTDFLPIRAGQMRIIRLRVVDTFGQTFDQVALNEANPITSAQHFTHEVTDAAPDRVSLLPRLSQPARLNFRWLAARDEQEEFNQHPATTPICGWVLPNYLDQALDVYDQHGTPLGIIRNNATWAPFPGSNLVMSISDIPNTHLRRMVNYLIDQGATFIDNFISVVQRSLLNIEPEFFSQHQGTALLVGRPLALVRARLSLEIKGLPAYNQSWNALRNDFSKNTRTHDNFTQVKFPIRLGEHQQLNDGVVGYWQETPEGTYADDLFYAPEVLTDGSNNIRSSREGVNLEQAVDDPPTCVSMLMDVHGLAHATSGVVPTKSIEVPSDQYADALTRLVAAIRTMPILTPGNEIALSLPKESGYQWSWLEQQGANWSSVPLEATVQLSNFTALFGQTKGQTLWNLLLTPAYGWLHLKGEATAYIPPVAQRTQATLNSPFNANAAAINQILNVYRTSSRALTQQVFVSAFNKVVTGNQGATTWQQLLAQGWVALTQKGYLSNQSLDTIELPASVNGSKDVVLGLLADVTQTPTGTEIVGGKTRFLQKLGLANGEAAWQYLVNQGFVVVSSPVAYILPVTDRNNPMLPEVYEGDLDTLNNLLDKPSIQPSITKVGFGEELVLRDGWLALTPEQRTE